MTLVFCDGFDSYAATADLTKKWRSVTAPWVFVPGGGRFGGGAIQAATTGGGTISGLFNLSNPTSGSSGPVQGFHFKISGPPSALSTLFGGFTSGGAVGCEVRVDTTGFLKFYSSGTAAPTLSGMFNVCDGNWHWVEFWNNNNFGNNTFAVYVDSTNCGTAVAASTGAFTVVYYQFTSIAGITITIDDLICWNNASAPFASFPIGPRQITTIRPASDGVCTFANLSSGSAHYALVNETVPDGDTSWVSDGTSGHQDLYNYGALGYAPAVINAVMINNSLKNPNAGSINFQNACKSGATTTLGASILTLMNYATLQTPIYVDPNTSAAWTPAGLNAAQFGIKVP